MKKSTLLFILFALGGCVATEPVVINKYEPFTNDSAQKAHQVELEKVDKLRKLKQNDAAYEKLTSLREQGSINAKIYHFNEYKQYYFNEEGFHGCVQSGYRLYNVVTSLKDLASAGVKPYMFEAALCKMKSVYINGFISTGRYLDGLISQGDPVAKALNYFVSLNDSTDVGSGYVDYRYSYPFLSPLTTYKQDITSEDLVGFGEVVDFILAYGKNNIKGNTSYNKEFLYRNGMCFGNGLILNKGICTENEKYTIQSLRSVIDVDKSLLHVVNTLYRDGALKNKEKLAIALKHLDRLLETYESAEISKAIKKIKGDVSKLNSL